MTRQEQTRFVKELTKNVTAEVLGDIISERVPETWNGIELRQLLADRFTRAVIKGIMTPARKRRYNQEAMAHNL